MNAVADLLKNSLVRDLGPLPAPRLDVNATVQHAVQMLIRARRGAVIVLTDTRPVGIFTERDIVYRIADGTFSPGGTGRHTPLRDVMSQPLVTAPRSARLSDAMALMVEKDCRHLVVLDGQGELRGLLTTADLVQFLTDRFPEDTVHLPPRLRQEYDRPEGA